MTMPTRNDDNDDNNVRWTLVGGNTPPLRSQSMQSATRRSGNKWEKTTTFFFHRKTHESHSPKHLSLAHILHCFWAAGYFFLQTQLQWTNWSRNFNGKIANFLFFWSFQWNYWILLELWLIDFLVVSSYSME